MKEEIYSVPCAAPHGSAYYDHLLVCDLSKLSHVTQERWGNFNGNPALLEVKDDPAKGKIINVYSAGEFVLACLERIDELPVELQEKLKEAMKLRKCETPQWLKDRIA